MALKGVRFIGLFLTGIISGVYTYSVIASGATKRLSASALTEVFQEAAPDFARIMPVVGISALAADVLTLALDRKVRSRSFVLTVAALVMNFGGDGSHGADQCAEQ